MPGQAITAALIAVLVQAMPMQQRGPERLPPPRSPPAAAPAKPAALPRIPIDLGPDAPASDPPQTIDILAPPPTSEAASAAVLKECADSREAGIVSGEIVVCREVEVDTSQIYSGSREAWLKAYGERTQNANTIAPPDVAGAGIFRGAPTVSGLCFIPPCPDEAPLIIDVEAIETPPPGSDAERVAQGLIPREGDDAPLSDEARRRIEAELGLPDAVKKDPPAQRRSP